MVLTIPNLLTLLRIVLIPLFVGLFYLSDQWLSAADKDLLATAIFAAAAITDWLDGYLARVLNQTSAFGAFLDPVADKLMVAAALVVLVKLNRVDMLAAIVIIGREIAISALREWMAQLGKSKSVAVSFVGKLKTATQMSAILLLLYNQPIFNVINSRQWGGALILAAVILTLWSMGYYLKVAWQQLNEVS